MPDVTIITRGRETETTATGVRRPSARRLLPVIAAVCAAGALPVHADEHDEQEGFRIELGQAVRWEDNLFRLPSGERPREGGPRSDRVSRTSLGLGFRHTYSLQHVAADLEFVRRSYAEHDNLDSTAKSGSLRWDWQAGNQWFGTLGLRQREAPRSFAEIDRRVRSINTLRRAEAEAGYRWHPSWSGLVGAQHTRSRFSDDVSAGAEYDETAVEAGVGFHPASGNALALLLRFADGTYPNRTPTDFVDSGYEQQDLRVRGKWAFSGVTSLSGYAGYTRREYDNVSRLDFSGPTGRVTLDWKPTGKLSFQLTGRSEIGSEYEVVDNYVLTRGIALEGVWSATDKIAVRVYTERLRRDYGDVREALRGKDNRTRIHGIGVSYEALRNLLVTVSAQRARRSADDPRFDYTARVIGLDVQLGLDL